MEQVVRYGASPEPNPGGHSIKEWKRSKYVCPRRTGVAHHLPETVGLRQLLQGST